MSDPQSTPKKSVSPSRPSGDASYRIRFEEKPIDTLVVIPPDGGWAWIVLLVSFIGNMFVDSGIYLTGLFLEAIAVSLKTDEAQVSIANSIMTACYCLASMLFFTIYSHHL